MGVCSAKNQTSLVSPVKQLKIRHNYNLGQQVSLTVTIPNFKNGQILQDGQHLKNFQINIDNNSSSNEVYDKALIIEQMTKEYKDLFNIKYFDYEHFNFIVTAKDSTKNNAYVRISRRQFQKFEQLSFLSSQLIQLKKLKIQGLMTYDDIKMNYSKGVYIIDRFFYEPAQKILDSFLQKWDYSNYILTLQVMQQISKSLSQLHEAGYAYKILRPSSIYVLNGEIKKQNIVLMSPNYIWTTEEQNFLQEFLDDEVDYMKYDSMCVVFLFITLLIPEITWESLFKIKTEEDRLQLLASLINKLPQVLLETLNNLLVIDKTKFISCSTLERSFYNIIHKGQQTLFKFDSFGAYLFYHGKKHLNLQLPFMYMIRKNQIHFLNFQTMGFNIIKLYRKKKRFMLKSPVAFSHFDDHFYFFVNNNSSKAVRIFLLNSLAEKQQVIKCEVDFFKSLRGVEIQDPYLFCISSMENQNDIIIFNNKKQKDERNQDSYYKSYIIQVKDEKLQVDSSIQMKNKFDQGFEQVNQNQNIGEWKQYIKVYEGPNNYQQRSTGIFYFYDIHNKYFYSIPDNSDIFENGIRYCFVDMSVSKGDFKEGILRFACGSPDIYEEFCKISFKIAQVEWAIEVQHGVFLIFASKNIFILDFNFKCFYSFASLQQLQFYEKNHILDPISYQYAFEIRNQPFEVKFPFQSSLGRNVIFQDGHLYLMGRKDIETVLCKYQLLPEQGAMVLQKCISMNSKIDILSNLPLQINSLINYPKVTQDETGKNPQLICSYSVIKAVNEKEDLKIYSVFDENNKQYAIKQVKISSFEDYYYSIKIFEQQIKTKYLVECKECFLTIDSQKKLYINLVEELSEKTLEDEIKQRKKNKSFFEPKEIAYLLKIILKAVMHINDNNISHGNIMPFQVFFLKNGQTKLAGWHLLNGQLWKSDFIDACAVINNCVTLEINNYNQQFNIQKLQQYQQYYDRYNGLYQFILKIMTNFIDGYTQQSLDELKVSLKKIYRSLQLQNLDINRISTNQNVIFWIAYGNCYIVSIHYSQKNFVKTIVKHPDGSLYKFSKYSMFAFDVEKIMYISGSIKEDLKKQSFYSLEFTFVNNDEIKLNKLPDIPSNILSPTLYYCFDQVFCFGGYEIQENGSKIVSKKAFMYRTKKKIWKQVYSLPISLVNATAICSQNNKDIIYLFGGISDQLDLTGKEFSFLQYSISRDNYEFKLDLGNKSPFLNSRFMKPIIDVFYDDIFVCFQKITGEEETGYFFEIFELQRGGIYLKFQYKEKIDRLLLEEKQEINIFIDNNPSLEYKKILQDDLSMVIKKNIIYNLDETDKSLVQLNFLNSSDEVTLQKIPCTFVNESIILDKDDVNQEDKFRGN